MFLALNSIIPICMELLIYIVMFIYNVTQLLKIQIKIKSTFTKYMLHNTGTPLIENSKLTKNYCSNFGKKLLSFEFF